MKKTYDEIAEEVIAGKWGDGAEREKKLTAAGYDFRAINKMASEKIKIYLTLGKRYYIVKDGDTLKSIANKYSISITRLITLNNISKGIKVGQRLIIK